MTLLEALPCRAHADTASETVAVKAETAGQLTRTHGRTLSQERKTCPLLGWEQREQGEALQS